uniref:Uncharacterized protein n=1 Tax=Rhizophora mucronata TaxID=61149 RepID=A0A2P2PMT8_RHIMU
MDKAELFKELKTEKNDKPKKFKVHLHEHK